MVHLLCTALDLTSPESTSQCVLTTHSPYILTALNNLMYGAKIMREFPEREKEVRKILGETDLVHPEHVRAYHFEDGGVRPLMDTETGIILADAIDEVSGSLAAEFEALADVEFTEKPL